MQGFNMGRYVPPDAEGLTSGNALHKKHALGARASKLRTEGVLTVRFEMPFAVWCGTCPKPTIIGQGVRFNAEKKKVGNYHSTPIYSFRMRHAACGGAIEIRTDPANTAYVVVTGARRRDHGDDDDDEKKEGGGGGGSLVGARDLTPAAARARQEQRESAFASLEKTIADRAAFEAARERIDDLEDDSARRWEDPYTHNQALRQAFRVGRKARERDAAAAEDLQDRMGLGIELLPESEEDARRAALVDFGTAGEEESVEKVLAKPLFGAGKRDDAVGAGKKGVSRKLKAEVAATKMRESLVSEIVGNTRLITDPFLESKAKDTASRAPSRLPGVKRKRVAEELPDPPEKQLSMAEKTGPSASGLVDYDSD